MRPSVVLCMYQEDFCSESIAASKKLRSAMGEARHSSVSDRVRPFTGFTAVDMLEISSRLAAWVAQSLPALASMTCA